jgi:Alginate lyase
MMTSTTANDIGLSTQHRTEFGLYRIIGNSLPPRHAASNALSNLKFILDREPDFMGCEKWWVLNRIADVDLQQRMQAMIADAGQKTVVIPFSSQQHFNAFLDASGLPKSFESHDSRLEKLNLSVMRKEWYLRHKSQTIAGINFARNVALRHGRAYATWTLPLDGGVMFSAEGWNRFVDTVHAHAAARFVIIPMARLQQLDDFAKATQNPTLGVEPQIAFHHDSTDVFDERLRYGNRNKVELFTRIGFHGVWDTWASAPWDVVSNPKSNDAGRFAKGGHVMRLPTGASSGIEARDASRWTARFDGIEGLSAVLDGHAARENLQKNPSWPRLDYGAVGVPDDVRALCDSLLQRPILSILKKTKTAPSGDPRDLYIPPRYLKASAASVPTTNPQLAPSTSGIYDHDLEPFDQFVRHSHVLANIGLVARERGYSDRAATLVSTWMINPTTRMNPHLHYAQYDEKAKRSKHFGIVSARDIWLLPQTLQCLAESQTLSDEDLAKARRWCVQLLRGFAKSEQFQDALAARNNISTWAAAMATSLGLYLDEVDSSMDILRYLAVRFVDQLGPLHIQNYEYKRTRPLHYSLFNLAAWAANAAISRRVGIELLNYKGLHDESLRNAIRLLTQTRDMFSDYAEDAQNFDLRIRILSIVFGLADDDGSLPTVIMNRDWGLPPFWRMLLATRTKRDD